MCVWRGGGGGGGGGGITSYTHELMSHKLVSSICVCVCVEGGITSYTHELMSHQLVSSICVCVCVEGGGGRGGLLVTHTSL